MENPLDKQKFGWSTVYDIDMKLVIHVAIQVTKVVTDQGHLDPDGVPVVWVEGRRITRVRKMTSEEYVEYVKKYGLQMNIDVVVAQWKNKLDEQDSHKKDEEDIEGSPQV